jgi:hypothetical protein
MVKSEDEERDNMRRYEKRDEIQTKEKMYACNVERKNPNARQQWSPPSPSPSPSSSPNSNNTPPPTTQPASKPLHSRAHELARVPMSLSLSLSVLRTATVTVNQARRLLLQRLPRNTCGQASLIMAVRVIVRVVVVVVFCSSPIGTGTGTDAGTRRFVQVPALSQQAG